MGCILIHYTSCSKLCRTFLRDLKQPLSYFWLKWNIICASTITFVISALIFIWGRLCVCLCASTHAHRLVPSYVSFMWINKYTYENKNWFINILKNIPMAAEPAVCSAVWKLLHHTPAIGRLQYFPTVQKSKNRWQNMLILKVNKISVVSKLN
jgi:hypothetical protein